CYCIEIQDNGIGIEETKLKALLDSQYFDDNENKKVQGLAICKNLRKRHNGWLGSDSQINKGRVFRVYLPIIKKPKTLDNTEKILAVPENGKTILVIDDNEMMLKIASQMLNKCGHKVLLANNGTDGIQTFKNNSGISLVLLDLIMPDLSGLDVFYQLRQLRSDIPIIFMSGINEKKELAACNGYNGFLTKPYSLNELSRKIFDVLK
ncbi:MAG: response regulator, partial [Spirochaetales bacterium]|nr:response regulator [Spirochaetales bacterium]